MSYRTKQTLPLNETGICILFDNLAPIPNCEFNLKISPFVNTIEKKTHIWPIRDIYSILVNILKNIIVLF